MMRNPAEVEYRGFELDSKVMTAMVLQAEICPLTLVEGSRWQVKSNCVAKVEIKQVNTCCQA